MYGDGLEGVLQYPAPAEARFEPYEVTELKCGLCGSYLELLDLAQEIWRDGDPGFRCCCKCPECGTVSLHEFRTGYCRCHNRRVDDMQLQRFCRN